MTDVVSGVLITGFWLAPIAGALILAWLLDRHDRLSGREPGRFGRSLVTATGAAAVWLVLIMLLLALPGRPGLKLMFMLLPWIYALFALLGLVRRTGNDRGA